jgi:hypothetical protein
MLDKYMIDYCAAIVSISTRTEYWGLRARDRDTDLWGEYFEMQGK